MGLRSVYMSLGFPARTAAIGISGDVIVSTRLARAREHEALSLTALLVFDGVLRW